MFTLKTPSALRAPSPTTPSVARPRTRAPFVVLAATLSGAVLAAPPVWADAAADAETAIKAGTELRRKGEDRAALAEFQRAMRLHETPRALAQVGLAEQALGLWVDANLHVSRALDVRADAWIEKYRATLETARTTIQSHLAQVEVWGLPNGAEVRFDGTLVGTLPSVTAWVGTGDLSMAVTAPGHAPLTRLLTIPGAGRSREHVQLRLLPAMTQASPSAVAGSDVTVAGTTPSTTGDPASPALTEGGAHTGDSAPAPSASHPIYEQWWFWAAIGVVAIGTGAGIYLLTRDSTTCAAPPCDSF